MKTLYLSHFRLHSVVMVSHGNLAVSIIQGMVYAQEEDKVTNVLTITVLVPLFFLAKMLSPAFNHDQSDSRLPTHVPCVWS